MEFEWDKSKESSNIAKHGVDFSDASDALYDVLAMTHRDDYPLEDRYVTIGLGGSGKLLVVVYTWRRDVVRIISARRATKFERARYEEKP